MKKNYSKCVLILSTMGYVFTMCLYIFAFFISQDLFGVNNFAVSIWMVENGYSALYFGGISLTISGALLLVSSILKILENKKYINKTEICDV